MWWRFGVIHKMPIPVQCSNIVALYFHFFINIYIGYLFSTLPGAADWIYKLYANFLSYSGISHTRHMINVMLVYCQVLHIMWHFTVHPLTPMWHPVAPSLTHTPPPSALHNIWMDMHAHVPSIISVKPCSQYQCWACSYIFLLPRSCDFILLFMNIFNKQSSSDNCVIALVLLNECVCGLHI